MWLWHEESVFHVNKRDLRYELISPPFCSFRAFTFPPSPLRLRSLEYFGVSLDCAKKPRLPFIPAARPDPTNESSSRKIRAHTVRVTATGTLLIQNIFVFILTIFNTRRHNERTEQRMVNAFRCTKRLFFIFLSLSPLSSAASFVSFRRCCVIKIAKRNEQKKSAENILRKYNSCSANTWQYT